MNKIADNQNANLISCDFALISQNVDKNHDCWIRPKALQLLGLI